HLHLLPAGGEGDEHGRAVLGDRVDEDASAVELGDAGRDVEAQTGALTDRGTAREPLEQPGALVLAHAAALVADRDDDVAVGGVAPDDDLVVDAVVVSQRVADEVAHELLDELRVQVHASRWSGRVEGDGAVP